MVLRTPLFVAIITLDDIMMPPCTFLLLYTSRLPAPSQRHRLLTRRLSSRRDEPKAAAAAAAAISPSNPTPRTSGKRSGRGAACARSAGTWLPWERTSWAA